MDSLVSVHMWIWAHVMGRLQHFDWPCSFPQRAYFSMLTDHRSSDQRQISIDQRLTSVNFFMIPTACVQDIRLNNVGFPMTPSENADGVSLTEQVNVKDGCARDDCTGVSCPAGTFCYPLWGKHECRCVKISQSSDWWLRNFFLISLLFYSFRFLSFFSIFFYSLRPLSKCCTLVIYPLFTGVMMALTQVVQHACPIARPILVLTTCPAA